MTWSSSDRVPAGFGHQGTRGSRYIGTADGSGPDVQSGQGHQGAYVALPGATPGRGPSRRRLFRTVAVHLQRLVRRTATGWRALHRGAGQRVLVVSLAHSGPPDP